MKRGRGDAKAYTAEFERLWAGCAERRGNKFPAFKAFEKFKPDVDLVIKRYDQRRQTDQWQRGIVPHLSTLLNERFWEVEPDAAEYLARDGTRPAAVAVQPKQKPDPFDADRPELRQGPGPEARAMMDELRARRLGMPKQGVDTENDPISQPRRA